MASGHDILQVETVEVRHPCYPALEHYAREVGADLARPPQEIKTGEQHTFLIWGSDPCVYYNEREGEVGHGARAWVEEYAKTGAKPDSGQHGER